MSVMPRGAREKSKSGYYHIVLRGIGRQNIFEDDEDNQRFIETLMRYKQEMKFELHSYCLMGNHVHILLKDEKNELDLIMKKIAGSYAYYFNKKYERVGHLFQDRFKSEAVEDEAYYLTVVRYIHQNPVKAGITKDCNYLWSSYLAYLNKSEKIETKMLLDLLGGIEKFTEYSEYEEKNKCLEIIEKASITDKKAKELLVRKYGIKNFVSIGKLETSERNLVLQELKKEGLSIRQLERLTGLNRGVIQRV